MRYAEHGDLPTDGLTLVEGLPGHGLVASIAVEEIVDQLGLSHVGSVESAAHFPVLSYEDGGVRDPVRVYARDSTSVVGLVSDTAVPPAAFADLGRTLVDALADSLSLAVFLVEVPTVGPPGETVVSAVGSTPALRSSFEDAAVPVEADAGLIVGPTGALASAFYHAGVPTAVLLVKTDVDPFVPDPLGAKALIDDALEPLVDFSIDTAPLAERAESIRENYQRTAAQFRQLTDGDGLTESTYEMMYH